MGYVSDSLVDNEQIFYEGKITNFIFLPGFIMFIGSFIVLFAFSKLSITSLLFVLLFFGGLYSLISSLIYKISTELAVTNKRVIAKTGLIRRNTIELNHDKVESFRVDQSILGRLLNYGNIDVRGTGGINTPIKNIDNPMLFKKQVAQVIDNQ